MMILQVDLLYFQLIQTINMLYAFYAKSHCVLIYCVVVMLVNCHCIFYLNDIAGKFSLFPINTDYHNAACLL